MTQNNQNSFDFTVFVNIRAIHSPLVNIPDTIETTPFHFKFSIG